MCSVLALSLSPISPSPRSPPWSQERDSAMKGEAHYGYARVEKGSSIQRRWWSGRRGGEGEGAEGGRWDVDVTSVGRGEEGRQGLRVGSG
jgi:hypothetical protein